MSVVGLEIAITMQLITGCEGEPVTPISSDWRHLVPL
jgi:hypothetical protein